MQKYHDQMKALANQMQATAETIYNNMDSRAVQGGAIDDEAEMLSKFSRRLMKSANEVFEFMNS